MGFVYFGCKWPLDCQHGLHGLKGLLPCSLIQCLFWPALAPIVHITPKEKQIPNMNIYCRCYGVCVRMCAYVLDGSGSREVDVN